MAGQRRRHRGRADQGRGCSKHEDLDAEMVANLKEPEPRREADVYFSEEEEFSEYECEGCGSKSVGAS